MAWARRQGNREKEKKKKSLDKAAWAQSTMHRTCWHLSLVGPKSSTEGKWCLRGTLGHL